MLFGLNEISSRTTSIFKKKTTSGKLSGRSSRSCLRVPLRTLLMPLPILAEPHGGLAQRCVPRWSPGREGEREGRLRRTPSGSAATSRTRGHPSERCCSAPFKGAEWSPSSPCGTVGVVVSGTDDHHEKRSGAARSFEVCRSGFRDARSRRPLCAMEGIMTENNRLSPISLCGASKSTKLS